MKHKATRHKNYILWLFSLSTRTSLCWNEHSDPGNAISTRKLQVQVPITRGTPRAGSKGGGVLQSLEQAIHDDALQRDDEGVLPFLEEHFGQWKLCCHSVLLIGSTNQQVPFLFCLPLGRLFFPTSVSVPSIGKGKTGNLTQKLTQSATQNPYLPESKSIRRRTDELQNDYQSKAQQ